MQRNTPDRALPVVAAVHVAAAPGAPVEAVEEVEVVAGRGLVGDRYFGTRHRHVSLVSAAAVEAAGRDLGLVIAPGATRRNLTLDTGDLPTTPGTRITIGTAVLEVVRVAAPCAVMDVAVAPGARRALRGRGGVVCRALASGRIRVGQSAVIEEPPPGTGLA